MLRFLAYFELHPLSFDPGAEVVCLLLLILELICILFILGPLSSLEYVLLADV